MYAFMRKPEIIQNILNYFPEMRFELADGDKRYFTAERFCYRGSIDD